MKKARLYRASVGTTLFVPDWGFCYTVWNPKPFPLPSIPLNIAEAKVMGYHSYKAKVPKREVSRQFPEPKIIKGKNPNKASVNHNTGVIFVDSGYWAGLLPYQKLFILLHEKGHERYDTEWKCDVYALQKMIELGFPETVAFHAQESTRSGFERNKIIHNTIKHFNHGKKSSYKQSQ